MDKTTVRAIQRGLMDHTLPTDEELLEICRRIRLHCSSQSNVVNVSGENLIIVGDLHGQFYDFHHMLTEKGLAGQEDLSCLTKNFLFLGDYVDRGHNSLETILLIFLMALLNPEKVTILRGNHELRQTCQVYGFYDEVLKRYGTPVVWKEMNDTFDYLPLAAVVSHAGDQYYCVHGGLSPTLRYLDMIQAQSRFREIEAEDPLSDLMWSDPEESSGSGFQPNTRGSGYLFYEDVCQKFLHENGFRMVIRSHQLAREGFKYFYPSRSCVIVWSVPNYCYVEGNKASIIKLRPNAQLMETDFVLFDKVEERIPTGIHLP